MTCIRFAEFLFFLVFLSEVCSKEPDITFRTEGHNVVMGYCFGVDYIVVYRSTSKGDQLLGNSSNEYASNETTPNLQGRIEVKEDMHLLGIEISDLSELDSGLYRWECWQDQAMVSHRTEHVSVCREEVPSEQIVVKENGGAELLCKSTAGGLNATSVRWYQEMHPSYNPVLFLDSSVSMKPLLEELQGLVEARDNGALLVLDKSLLNTNPEFYCLVIKGENCLSFQNMYPRDRSESRGIFVSLADAVVLNCPADSNQQQWETPLGEIDSDSIRNNQMYISAGDESKDFSLIIPVTADEHSGKYSCISPLTEIEYSLLICPKNKSQVKVAYKGSNVSLECIFPPSESQKVYWQRHLQSGLYEAIFDGENQSIPIQKDLFGKVSLSDGGHLLTISDVDVKHAGVYSCAVLKGPEFLPYGDYDDYYDYNDTIATEDEYRDEEIFDGTERCIFKQDFVVNISANKVGDLGTFGVNSPTDEPEKAPNVTVYVVVIVVVGLLVGIAVVLIVRKRNAKAASNIQMDLDPHCKDRLTSKEDVA